MPRYTSMRAARIALTATGVALAVGGAVATPAVMAAETLAVSYIASAAQEAVATVAAQEAVTASPDDGVRVAAAVSRARKPRVPGKCRNDLVLTLREAGFKGKNVKEAWAIAMRESNGHADLGPGHPQFNGSDYGLFQFNQPSWGGKSWFDTTMLLDGVYNASVAFDLSRGGRDWLHWGLNGDGTPNFAVYSSIWSAEQMQAWIVEPYERYSAEFDALPRGCRRN